MYSSLEVGTATSNGVEMSLTRIVFIDINIVTGVYSEYRPSSHEGGIANTKIVNVAMWSVPEVSYMQLELLYGNKCRCDIFGGTAHVS